MRRNARPHVTANDWPERRCPYPSPRWSRRDRSYALTPYSFSSARGVVDCLAIGGPVFLLLGGLRLADELVSGGQQLVEGDLALFLGLVQLELKVREGGHRVRSTGGWLAAAAARDHQYCHGRQHQTRHESSPWIGCTTAGDLLSAVTLVVEPRSAGRIARTIRIWGAQRSPAILDPNCRRCCSRGNPTKQGDARHGCAQAQDVAREHP